MPGRLRQRLSQRRSYRYDPVRALFADLRRSHSAHWRLGADWTRDTFGKTDMALAERQGFEPWVPSRVRRISSAVHSTTLPPLREVLQGAAAALPNRRSVAVSR